jgi:hypothetical protein
VSEGVTVNVPLDTSLKLYLPFVSVVVTIEALPARVTVTPGSAEPPDVIIPEIPYVGLPPHPENIIIITALNNNPKIIAKYSVRFALL